MKKLPAVFFISDSWTANQADPPRELEGNMPNANVGLRSPRYTLKSIYRSVTLSVLGIVASSVALAAAPSSGQSAAALDSETPEHVQWRKGMLNRETPGEGCFQANFPSTSWEQVSCRAEPLRAHPRRLSAASIQPQTTGNGNDYALVAPHFISKTVGSFPSVTNVTSESSVGVAAFGGGGILGANEYSLQINTNFDSSTPACSGGAAQCTVWQQFVYATDAARRGSAAVFIQYWLINYGASGASCPSGYYKSGSDCYKNSNFVSAPDVSATQLANLTLTGTAVPGGLDSVTFAIGTQAYSISATDNVLQIGTVWYQSEFNVVGDAGGSEAVFNRGSSITVNVAAQYGSSAAPECASNSGSTGETNNLNLGPCTSSGGSTPSIQFTESLSRGRIF